MECNWLGFAFVSEDLPCEIEEMVNQKVDELKEKAEKEFDDFLDRNGLKQVTGVIVRKGSINDSASKAKKEKRNSIDNSISKVEKETEKEVRTRGQGWEAEVFCPTCGTKLGDDQDWTFDQKPQCPKCGQKLKEYP